VTTFCTVVAELRIWLTLPLNVCPENASTVNVASMSGCRRPTSPSATLVWTCMVWRSSAMVKMTGADIEAATV